MEMRIRVDGYYKVVVRSLREVIPKQVFYWMLVWGFQELQFECYKIIGGLRGEL